MRPVRSRLPPTAAFTAAHGRGPSESASSEAALVVRPLRTGIQHHVGPAQTPNEGEKTKGPCQATQLWSLQPEVLHRKRAGTAFLQAQAFQMCGAFVSTVGTQFPMVVLPRTHGQIPL